jgi:hypothetical protein
MWQEPKFDRHAFDRRAHAVSATKTREGWDTTGLSFADFQSMKVHTRRPQARRLPRPAWSESLEGIRAVTLNYLERRFYINTHLGTDAERIQRIQAKAVSYLPTYREVLNRLLLKHKVLDESGRTKDAEKIAVQVQVIDSTIVTVERGVVALTVAMVYSYFALGYSSVQVAEEFHVKSPCVRATIKRMCDLAPKIVDGRLPEGPHRGGGSKKKWNGERLAHLFMLRTTGVPLHKVAQIFGVTPNTIGYIWRNYFKELRSPSPGQIILPKTKKLQLPRKPKKQSQNSQETVQNTPEHAQEVISEDIHRQTEGTPIQ